MCGTTCTKARSIPGKMYWEAVLGFRHARPNVSIESAVREYVSSHSAPCGGSQAAVNPPARAPCDPHAEGRGEERGWTWSNPSRSLKCGTKANVLWPRKKGWETTSMTRQRRRAVGAGEGVPIGMEIRAVQNPSSARDYFNQRWATAMQVGRANSACLGGESRWRQIHTDAAIHHNAC